MQALLQFKTSELHLNYKSVSNSCSLVLRLSKIVLLMLKNNLVSDGRLGSFYKDVNNKLNGSNGIASLKNGNGVTKHSVCDEYGIIQRVLASQQAPTSATQQSGKFGTACHSVKHPELVPSQLGGY